MASVGRDCETPGSGRQDYLSTAHELGNGVHGKIRVREGAGPGAMKSRMGGGRVGC